MMSRQRPFCPLVATILLMVGLLFGGCQITDRQPVVGAMVHCRTGQEFMAAGQFFHVGAPVVLWFDQGGYDAYRVEHRFASLPRSSWEEQAKANRSPARYSPRFFRYAEQQPQFWPEARLTPEDISRVRGGAWDLPTLQKCVDQFVLHYDVCGVSRQCFRVLHDIRGLSVHFMIDIDGTIYQTLDLQERAFHATTSNDRSVGVEIANMGAYSDRERNPFAQWYAPDPDHPQGWPRITIPPHLGDGGIRTPGFIGRPARPDPVRGQVQGRELTQYDFTPEQYDSLIRLTAALSRVFPNMPLDYPRDAEGRLVTTKLDEDSLRRFQGVIGHFHIQEDKVDPGPAMQWDYVIDSARRLFQPRTGSSAVTGVGSRKH